MKNLLVENNDFGELGKAAAEIIRFAAGNRVIALQGDLGAGKTTLIQSFCRNLGVVETVSSPTFTIINEYLSDSGLPVYHLDMYRLEKESDALQLGLDELFRNEGWFFIEWPEKIESWLPENYVSLKIEVDSYTKSRTITFRNVKIVP